MTAYCTIVRTKEYLSAGLHYKVPSATVTYVDVCEAVPGKHTVHRGSCADPPAWHRCQAFSVDERLDNDLSSFRICLGL